MERKAKKKEEIDGIQLEVLKHEFINTKADINEINYDFGKLIQENS